MPKPDASNYPDGWASAEPHLERRGVRAGLDNLLLLGASLAVGVPALHFGAKAMAWALVRVTGG